MMGGRAVATGKYKRSYCAEMVSYFENYSGKGIPEFSKFARKIGVTTRTLENWVKKYPKFGEAYEICSEIKDERMKDGGLCGSYNSRVVIFLLEAERKRREAASGEVVRFEDL